MDDPRRPLNLTQLQPAWWVSLLLVPLPAVIFVLAFGLAHGLGQRTILLAWLMSPVSVLVAVAYLALAILALIGATTPHATLAIRAGRVLFSVCLIGGIALLWPAVPVARVLELRARQCVLRAIPARAEPLIAALELYREDHEDYPPSLQALIPGYLDGIPGTGFTDSPEFHYERSDRAAEWKTIAAQRPPAYELSIGFGFWDAFRTLRYWPSQDYPETVEGHPVLARVDGWVYVDD